MYNDSFLSFYLNTYRIHVFRKTIHDIGNPRYIRFLVKEDGQSMIMEACAKKDQRSHRVTRQASPSGGMEVNSMPLCQLLKNRLDWEDGKTYRVPGRTAAPYLRGRL